MCGVPVIVSYEVWTNTTILQSRKEHITDGVVWIKAGLYDFVLFEDLRANPPQFLKTSVIMLDRCFGQMFVDLTYLAHGSDKSHRKNTVIVGVSGRHVEPLKINKGTLQHPL